jgi:predicted nucleic acid-binding protein
VLVLDASVVAAWFLPDELNEVSRQAESRLETEPAVVPALWVFEVANTLRSALRRERLPQGAAESIIHRLEQLPITIAPCESIAQATAILALALRHNLSAYDAAYLDLALRRDATLASLDVHLRRAAMDEGVSVL